MSLANDDRTLKDLFAIKRGLATGCNSFFILTPERIEAIRLPPEFFIPILPSPRELEGDQILADAQGNPRIKARRFLLACRLPERDVQANHPSLWKYFQSGVKAGIHQRYLCRNREPWYAQEIRPPAPLLCTYMGRPTSRSERPFRFILNHSQATAANVYLMLYPKPPLAATFKTNPLVAEAVWEALSSITAEMLMREGRTYGGGLHKLEPKELGNIPADVILNVLPPAQIPHRQRTLFADA